MQSSQNAYREATVAKRYRHPDSSSLTYVYRPHYGYKDVGHARVPCLHLAQPSTRGVD